MSPSPDPIQAAGPLASLSSELLVHILDNVDPASHLDFACTCKLIAKCSVDVLRRHRKAHDQWHVASDLQPLTIPTLLSKAMRDPVVAWHVRSLEIWGPRPAWNAWRPFMLEPPDRFDPNAQPLEWSFADDELAEYLRLLREVLHLSKDDISKARDELVKGSDGLLKVLTIALCPRLHDLKYVWCSEGNRDGSLRWLTLVMEPGQNNESWAPGFRSLRSVAIGVNSSTWLDRENDVCHDPSLLANILKLPNIDTVYFRGFYDEYYAANIEETDADEDPCPSPNSSTVRHLFIDGAEWMQHDYRQSLIAAPRALETLCMRGNGEHNRFDDMDRFVTLARKSQTDSLKSLMLYEAWGMHGYRCTVYRPDDVRLNEFNNLRHVCIDNADLISEAYYDDGELYELWSTDRETAIETVISQFPASMEVLLLGNISSLRDSEIVEGCLIGLIESGRYPDLKAIFLEDDKSRRRELLDTGPQEKLWFQQLIGVGEQHGVDINCTASGKRERIHEIEFPTAPDSASLASAPNSWVRGVETREFNAFRGRWQPKGCGNCGNCSSCFQVYTPEAWKAISGPSAPHNKAD